MIGDLIDVDAVARTQLAGIDGNDTVMLGRHGGNWHVQFLYAIRVTDHIRSCCT